MSKGLLVSQQLLWFTFLLRTSTLNVRHTRLFWLRSRLWLWVYLQQKFWQSAITMLIAINIIQLPNRFKENNIYSSLQNNTYYQTKIITILNKENWQFPTSLYKPLSEQAPCPFHSPDTSATPTYRCQRVNVHRINLI